MADIINVDELLDGGKGGKKKNKKKVFLILAGLVAVVALVMWYTKRNTGAVAYVASGYDGYPQMYSGEESGESLDEYSSEDFSDIVGYYENMLSEQQKSYNAGIDSVVSHYENELMTYTDNMEKSAQHIDMLQNELSYAQIVSQMKDNSSAYMYANADERADLVAENEALGYSIGATKDEQGRWWQSDGTRLYVNAHEASAQNLSSSYKTVDTSIDYMAVTQNLISSGHAGDSAEVSNATINRANKIVQTGTQSTYSVTYDKNVDYQAAINTAKANGESQAVIDTLTAQREAKIRGENLNADGSKK